jgi:hypothetical protein
MRWAIMRRAGVQWRARSALESSPASAILVCRVAQRVLVVNLLVDSPRLACATQRAA